MNAKFNKKQQHSQNIYTFWFKTDEPVNNVPGQYTEVTLPHANPDERGDKRWFTVYSSPTEDSLAITTKINSESSSFKKALLDLNIDTELNFAEPMGDFILPIDKSLPLVFIAGGIGVTPFRSIIKWLSDKNESRDIQLLYATNNQTEFIEQELLNIVDTKYIVSNPQTDWDGLVGKLSASKILELTNIKPNTHIFLSGPEPMVEAITKDLIATGQPEHQVITDYFPGYTSL